jgi:uncharacterized protein YjbI with pentapeptide repeats
MYTFVNKNYLIPIVINDLSKDLAFDKLYQETIYRNEEYNNNVYLVYKKDNVPEIFFSDGNNIYYKSNFNNNDKYNSIVYNFNKLNFMGSNLLVSNLSSTNLSSNNLSSSNLSVTNTNVKSVFEIEKNQKKEMNLSIENKSCNNVLLKDNTKKVSFDTNDNFNFNLKTEIVPVPCESTNDGLQNNNLQNNNLQNNNLQNNNLQNNNLQNNNLQNNNLFENDLSEIKKNAENSLSKKKEEDNIKNVEENEKKEQLISLIEQVNDLYQKELSNIKKLEMNLKVFDAKLTKLNKKKRENVVNDLIKTQSEYQTWKKLKYKIEDESDILKPTEELELSGKTVPVLFLSKYDYIDKIQENDGIRSLLKEINLIDLNKLYSDNILPDAKIVQFCEKYVKLSKELHYHFDHDWDYLENEMNLNSTNKLSNSI